MLSNTLYNRLKFIYLLIGVLSFGVICLDSALKVFPAFDFQIGLSQIIRDVFLIWFFVGHYLFIRDFLESREIYNVETLLRYVLVFGLLVIGIFYGVNALPTIIHKLQQGGRISEIPDVLPINPVLGQVLELVSIYLIIVFFMTTLILFKKLIFIRRRKREIRLWRIFQGMLLVGLIFNVSSLPIPELVTYFYLEGGLILVLLLNIRLRWIALLTTQEKWSCILLMTPVTLICGLLTKNLMEVNIPYILHVNIYRNVFLLLAMALVNIYAIFSLLALIFNLPIAQEMEQRKSEVSSYQEMNRLVRGDFHPNEVLGRLFRYGYSNTRAEGGWILMKDEVYDYFDSQNISRDTAEQLYSVLQEEFQFDEQESLYLTKTRDNPSLALIYNDYRSLLAIPIRARDRQVGMVCFLKTFAHGFDEFMIRQVRTYLDQTRLALENSEYIREALEAERLKEEFEIAKSVQQQLIPQQIPSNEYFEAWGFSRPASEVGGDYYDIQQLDDHRFALIIADVSGKGTSAAFHMAEMKGIFQALNQQGLSPKGFVKAANQALYECLEKNQFITVGYFLIDGSQQHISYYRGGQCPILYYDREKKEAHYIEDEGLALGILGGTEYESHLYEKTINYRLGDYMILVTDGVLEARHKRKHIEFGAHRLRDKVNAYLNEHSDSSAQQLNDHLINEVYEFMGDGQPERESGDDITLVTVRFRGES